MNDNDIFESLKKGLEEAVAYEKDDGDAKSTKITIMPLPNFQGAEIKRIREKLGLTQRNFAFVLGVSTKTVEAWECGRNTPAGPAQRFMQFLSEGGKKILEEYKIIC